MTFSASNKAAVEAESLTCALCVSIAFPSGTLRTTTRDGTVTIDGNDYLADGLLHGVPGGSERGDLKIENGQLVMALAEPLITKMADDYQFSEVLVYAVFFSGEAQVDAAELLGRYYLSDIQCRVGSERRAILNLEPETIMLDRTNGVIASPSDQKARYTGDTFDDYTAKIANMTINWGGRPTISGDVWTHEQTGGGGSRPQVVE